MKIDPRPVLFLAVGLPPSLTGALVLPFCAHEARPWVLATAAAVGESLAGHAQFLRLNFQPTPRRSDAGVN